jgi:hypothetical protein
MKAALWIVPAAVAVAVVAVVGLSRVPLEQIGAAPPGPQPPAFAPGVPGRGPAEVCHSTSAACQQWTELARKCEENMRQRDAGFMGRQLPHCSDMEALRERVTGIPDSGSPGAYSF